MVDLLAGKVGLITGGGSGIGRETALIFAREGAAVVIADIDAEGGEETVRRIVDRGGKARSVRVDVTQSKDVEALIEDIVRIEGRLDCAFNNAGTEGAMQPTAECDEAAFRRTLDLNVVGVWLCMRAEIRQMLTQGAGAIVNASSAAGLVGVRGFPDYVASKHAVLGLTKSAALEYATTGLRVNAVCPGVIDTPMVEREAKVIPNIREFGLAVEPVGRLGTAMEVGEAVTWLCSDAASFVTGHAMAVDGGAVAQ